MTDQTQRLEIATVKAEVGSNILSRFSNDAINAAGIPTDSGAIPNLKKIIKTIEDKASVSTTIYPTVAAGQAATAEGGMFLVASEDSDEIYEVWKKVSGAAVDTGKRALSSQAAQDAVTAAQTSAGDSAASALEAQAAAANAAEEFQDIFEADQLEREAEFRALMDASGYESVYLVYGAGVVVSRQTQLVQKDGELYRVTNAADLPLTLTGTWSSDALKLSAVGDAALRQSIESAEGYDQIGATLPTGVFSTVKGFFNWILDRITLSISGSAGIVDAVAKGGKVVIKNGVHLMAAPAVCDYSAYPEVGFPGTPSKRYDISGETPGGTTLRNQHSDYAVKLIGSHPVTQNISGLDAIGNLTILGPTITTPNTDGSGGSGIFVQTKAYTSIYRYSAFNLSLGLHLDGVLTSTVEDVNIVGCYEGLLINDVNNTSGPNATNLRRIKIGEATSNGARIEVGSSLQVDNLTIEGCGTRGGTAVGLLLQTKSGSIAATMTLNSPYFELNAGPADVYISHVAAQDMILNVNGGLFHRTSETKFVDTHFLVRSEPGAGRVTVNLKGVKFHGSFGYDPSSSFPYFDVGARCEVVWDGECQFSELVSMNYWLCLGREYTFTVSAAGAILSGPDGFSCTKISTGSYRFSRSAGKAEFSKFSSDYSVIGMPTTPASNIYLFDRQTTTFEVRLDNGSTLIDAPFSVTVKRINGYYA